jgi:hypothetical protein
LILIGGNSIAVEAINAEPSFSIVNATSKQATEFVLPAGATMIGWAGE